MEERLQQLEQQVQQLLTHPTNSATQQLKYPLDYTSQQIIKQFITTQAFPVGAIYTNVTGTNPATELGYGTWSAFGAGQVLVGYKSGDSDFGTVLNTGGEKTHTLTVSEMPSHSHSIYAGSNGTGNPSVAPSSGTGQTINPAVSGYITSTGGDGAHNNLQPFIVVYYWQRTA